MGAVRTLHSVERRHNPCCSQQHRDEQTEEPGAVAPSDEAEPARRIAVQNRGVPVGAGNVFGCVMPTVGVRVGVYEPHGASRWREEGWYPDPLGTFSGSVLERVSVGGEADQLACQ